MDNWLLSHHSRYFLKRCMHTYIPALVSFHVCVCYVLYITMLHQVMRVLQIVLHLWYMYATCRWMMQYMTLDNKSNHKSSFKQEGSCGAMVARLTPDQKVACSNHVGITKLFSLCLLFHIQ